MKTIIASILMLCVHAVIAQYNGNERYTIEVDVSKVSTKPEMVYLWYEGIGSGRNRAYYDSAAVIHGKARFKGTIAMSGEAYLAQVSRAELRAANRLLPDTKGDVLKFYLEPAALTIYCVDSLSNYVVTGGRYSKDYRQFKKMEDEFLLRRDHYYYPELERVFKEDSVVFKSLLLTYAMVELDYYNITLRNFVLSHLNSVVSLLALRAIQLRNGDDPRLSDTLLKSLSTSVAHAPEAEDIWLYREALGRTALGAMAPIFSLPDDTGDMHALESYRGSYVLLEFWSSDCGICWEEHRKLRHIYEQFRHRNFTILGVSLDTVREPWLAAIHQDGISRWAQLSDLKGFNSRVAMLYGVRNMRESYLIDPSGHIVAKNLWGDELATKLKEVFRSWQLETHTTPFFDKASRRN
ncbi:TlpA disulfide reductase family protein [Parachryseolinea silvisoli]|uniref:TlpA disulfide reductase family protein n=1 Tax=Parachryseolinea silvisoli TaxID=2873601 RepID=UPI002265E6F2|nr:TlpA disulfide reductase family protein [Parachryseolinea silvisoli]MCD9014216.1 AhpC/TSA family protein [Parachryseolinea silvisoli]